MTQRRPRRLQFQRGNTLLGLVIGVVIGLGIAVVVALLVTKATVPFVSKTTRPPASAEPEAGKLPDPNKGFYSKEAPAVAATSPSTTVIAPAPPNVAPGADGRAPAERPVPETSTMLQAGAFSNADDAESMRGRLALLGFESRVQPGEKDGVRIYRVRLGPYSRIDDLNRTRQRLIENGVEAAPISAGR